MHPYDLAAARGAYYSQVNGRQETASKEIVPLGVYQAMGLTLFRAAFFSTSKMATVPPSATHPNPLRLELLLEQTPATIEEQLENTWNSEDCSPNLSVNPEDPLTACRKPAENSTDCIRGKKGYASNLHVWELVWPQHQRGTHAMVGLATAAAPLHSDSYTALVGSDSESWGWDLCSNQLHHFGLTEKSAVYGVNGPATVPDSFLMVLDADRGSLGFVVDGEYLGDAFCGLSGKTLYPIVSSVWGDSGITLRYIGSLQRQPLLTELCRRSIQRALGTEQTDGGIASLPLPRRLQVFLQPQKGRYKS
ncbi:SPRY domain-containing SOCS box protein 4-like [Ambystoma mexicanum]|uniref:SPRY domain-containing SOCS box protein 4-like n=1 Tax=Ambystoma mexicanum TaxID=8296 RepID=UPI0037E8A073